MNIKEVAKQFKTKGKEITYLDRYGEGHINTTYLLVLDNEYKYILQKINNYVFPPVKELMENIASVLEYLKVNTKLSDPDRQIMHIIKTLDGGDFYYDEKEDAYYRVYDFVQGSIVMQKAENAEMYKESGIGFGKFACDLSGFNANELYEVIPDFHNTKQRLKHFKAAVSLDFAHRAKNCQTEIDKYLMKSDYASMIVDCIDDGSIPLRVTHNDTKINNILLDEKTKKALCVIDLDTIMPGSLLYDFGDSIRSGCNNGGEAEKDLSKVTFNLEYFQAFAEGYLSQAGKMLTPKEKELLPYSPLILTYECGMRFLDDYLDGDKYFRVTYEEHNLVRSRAQFKLFEDMEAHLSVMKEIVKKALENC